MRKLSTKRRHRFAGLFVLALGLLLTGGLYTAFAPDPATAETASQSDIEAGRELFLVGCASCHGLNAQGVVTPGTGEGNPGNYGPPLIGVGAASVDFQVGTGRMPMAQTGAQAPSKPSEYTREEIAQLSAYIASLAPGPAIPDERYLDWESVDAEGVAEGGEFFRTNCTACHNSTGQGGALPDGRYAPSLEGVEPRDIYTAMLTGPQQMPVFNDQMLTPEEKLRVIAYIKRVQDEPNWGGIGGGGLGPVVDGMFIWILGIGGMVGFAVWIAMHGTRTKKR